MASRDANEAQKVKKPFIWGNVTGTLVFHLLAMRGLFILPFTQPDGRTTSGVKTRQFVLSDPHQNYLSFRPRSCNYLGKMCRYVDSTVLSVYMQPFVTERCCHNMLMFYN
jgi:hypothetical protein